MLLEGKLSSIDLLELAELADTAAAGDRNNQVHPKIQGLGSQTRQNRRLKGIRP